jgi:hypothetical protein
MQLPIDQSFSTIPVFTLTKGKIAKTSGTYEEITVIYCAADGVMSLLGYEESVTMLAGDVFGIDKQSVTIVSGSWHLS